MAQEIIIRLTDDLDLRGGLKTEAAETISFAFRGKEYELDLSGPHVEELEDFLAPYIAVARKVSRPVKAVAPKVQASFPDVHPGRAMDVRRYNAAMRAWGKDHGWPDLEPGGYLPRDLRDAFAASLQNHAA